MDTKPAWASTPIQPKQVTVCVALPESGPLTDTRQTVKLAVFHGPNVSIHPSLVRLLILMVLGIPRLCAALQIVSVDPFPENLSGLTDEDPDPEDWIEPFNAGDTEVNLAVCSANYCV